MSNVEINGNLTLFADDTTILWIDKEQQVLQSKIREDVKKIKEWCDANYLTFSISKTNIMSFKCNIDAVALKSDSIKNELITKFLGITIDSKLNFSSHITSLARKLSAGCYAIRVVSKNLNHAMARSLYFSIIESNLRYGIAFWGFASNQLMQMVFVLQKRALRYLCGLNFRDHCREYFIKEGILTLASIFILESTTLIHKKYKSNQNSHRTRYSNELRLPIPRSSLTKKSVIYESKKMYNHLPTSFKSERCIRRFRSVLKKFLQSKAFYTVDEFYGEKF